MRKPDIDVASSSKIKFEDSDDDEEPEAVSEEEKEIEQELANFTFEELQKARSNGSVMVQKTNIEKKGGRENKNRPMEISTKKQVGRFREVIQVPKRVVRDPRFESLCGNLDEEGFKKRDDFLYKNDLPAEKEQVTKLLKKSNDPKLKDHLEWINKQLKSASSKRTDKEILSAHKKKEKEAAKKGKKPYYLKKSKIREIELIEKYNSLKASGKLESYIEKEGRKTLPKTKDTCHIDVMMLNKPTSLISWCLLVLCCQFLVSQKHL